MPLPNTPAILSFDAIGTHWEIETPAPLGTTVRDQVLRRIDDFDLTYSRFRPDSLVSVALSVPPC